MTTDRTGTYKLNTGSDVLTVQQVHPSSDRDKAKEKKEGPLFRITYTLSTFDKAKARSKELMRQHTPCRIHLIPYRREVEDLASGNFEVIKITEAAPKEDE